MRHLVPLWLVTRVFHMRRDRSMHKLSFSLYETPLNQVSSPKIVYKITRLQLRDLHRSYIYKIVQIFYISFNNAPSRRDRPHSIGITTPGPTVSCPYLRRREGLTICRCYSKGSTFSSIILRPSVLVWPGIESEPPAQEIGRFLSHIKKNRNKVFET